MPTRQREKRFCTSCQDGGIREDESILISKECIAGLVCNVELGIGPILIGLRHMLAAVSDGSIRQSVMMRSSFL